ncbi:MAG TPA: outer membrane lipoprotein carrier protein LolA [Elusimicrobiota bacterium]|jgi:outer membrane lipoprotein carrier protein|nr:outer membrane lipoprotein carrier protein LolA [Elusimicrobiota bacterium]
MRLVGLFLVGALGLLPAPSFAKSKDKPAPAKAADKPAPTPEQFLWKSTEPLTVEKVLAHFEVFDKDMTSLSARFTQSVGLSSTGMTSTVEGTVAYLKPEKLRVEHLKPEKQSIVCGGGEIWIYRPAQNQVVESALKDWREADPAFDNLMQFGSYAQMLKTYDVSLDTAPAPALVLRPKPKTGEPFELRMLLAKDTLFPAETVLAAGEARVRTRFEDVRFNPALDEKLFRFTPPEGADVFKNFKPPRFRP